MANHVAIASATELAIYFCDPHSPWQRATNENTNGLLRQYFPKSTDLSGYHRDYLDFVAAQLNNRPRKRLGWRTPAEALDQHSQNPRTTRCCADRLNPPGAKVPLPGHPVPGPDRDRPHPVGHAWKPALNAFAITFGDRFPAAETY